MKTLFTVNQMGDEVSWEVSSELTKLECIALIGVFEVVGITLRESLLGEEQ